MDYDDRYLDDINRNPNDTKYNIEETNLKANDYIRQNKTNRKSIVNQKAERMKRIRGLLFRIILACIIFILLFLGKQCSVELFDYNTDRVLEQVEDNSWYELLENKIKGWF